MLDDDALVALLGAAMGEPGPTGVTPEAVQGLLSDTEIRATVLRFGLEDGQLRSMSEVARELGIDREEVNRLTKGVLLKLQALVLEHQPPPVDAIGFIDFSLDRYPGATEATSELARSLHSRMLSAQRRVQTALVLREGDLYVDDTCILRSRFPSDALMVVDVRRADPPFDGMESAAPGWFSIRVALGKELGWGWSDVIAEAAVQAGATQSSLFGDGAPGEP